MDHDAQGTDTGTASPGRETAWGEGPTPEEGGQERERGRRAESDFGEDAELRRALELLDELVELDPDKLSLYRRRAEYARRLGDEDVVLDAYLRWAEVLERRGSWRSAHLLCQQAVMLEPESERASRALSRLEGERASGSDPSLPASPGWSRAWRDRATETDSDLASVIWPELRRALEEVNWLQAAALRMLPGAGEGPGDGSAAEREAAEILGRYFISREQYERAVEVLAPVLREEGSDRDRLDALYLKGLAHLRMDEEGRAEECFRRVARRDEEFRSVARWVVPGLEAA